MQLRERTGFVVALAVAAFAALVVGRVALESRQELRVARTHHAAGERARAIEHYRRALRWSLPLASNMTAIAGLESIAGELEGNGDREGALLAWRSLAGGLSAGRSLFVPTSRARERANAEIARLMALGGGAPIDARLSADKLEADHLRLLHHEASPDRFWGALLVLGFAAWLGSLLLLIHRGFEPSGRPRWPAARGPLWGALAGLASFVLGLLFA